jgi:hypothetical protein
VKFSQRRDVGRKVADLIIEAERRHPAPGSGLIKRNWVLREAKKTGPKGSGPSAEFGQWLGRYLLRVAIEVGVGVLNKTRTELAK